MREVVSTITSKGQVTIPVEVRRLLGVRPRDKIAFVIEDDQVRLARRGSVVVRTAGALRSREAPQTAEDLRASAEAAIAEEAVERVRR